jgi:hypothetical protein
MPITALLQTSLSRISPLVASPTTMARKWSLPPAVNCDQTNSTLAFELIRKVFKDLSYDKPQDGVIKWQDIPILGEALRGSKRDSAAMASDTRLTSADCVRAPNRSTLG